MHFVVLDIETTGLSPDINEIIEIGAVKFAYRDGRFELAETYSQLIKPYQKLPAMITSLTGISTKMLVDSPRFHEVIAAFTAFVGDAIIVAHNAQFDVRMINECLKRAEAEILHNQVIDTQDMVAIAFPMQSSHRLGDIVEALKIETGDLHRALEDALATAKVFIVCAERMKHLPLSVLMFMNKLLSQQKTPLKELFALWYKERIAAVSSETLAQLGDWKKEMSLSDRFSRSVYRCEPEDETPVDPELIEEYFGEQGKMAEVFAQYEARPQQVTMAKEIVRSFNDGAHFLCEAGTGTGKSAAYILPALLWLKHNGGPIVVSTRTKNLQEQLMDKDIPQLLRLFPEDEFQVLQLKGRQNYICLRRFDLLLQQLLLSGTHDLYKVLPLVSWIVTTAEGDISELHSSIEKRYSRQISAEPGACLYESCVNFNSCFVQHVRRQARYADLIVGNHALVFTDIALGGQILPQYERAVFDEAHTIEEAVTDAYSEVASFGVFTDHAKKADQLFKGFAYVEHMETFKSGLREFFTHFSSLARGLRRELRAEEKIPMVECRGAAEWPLVNEARLVITKALMALLPILDEQIEVAENDQTLIEMKAVRYALEHKWLAAHDMCEGKENYIAWLQRSNNNKEPFNIQLIAAPIDVGSILQEELWSTKRSVIATSATLQVQDSFSYIQNRLGVTGFIAERCMAQSVGSPYAYAERMLCVIPEEVSSGAERQQLIGSAEYIAEVVQRMRGRTMVLFTSYAAMEKVYRMTKQLLDDTDITILCQGTHGSRRSLLGRFRHADQTVLFGTSSFWEGVDIQGEALSCVIIAKLPFAVPTEPIVQARSQLVEDRGGSSFMDFSVPQAVIKFKQGIGRLIRSATDRGIIIVLDDRVYTKNYGKLFLAALPGCRVFKAPIPETLQVISAWNDDSSHGDDAV